MDLAALRTFLAVSRTLSYTRAAGEVHLSQPAAWRQVRRLEHDVGVRLVEQIGKSLQLTDAGRTLAHEAEELLANVGRLEEAVRLHARGARGRLRVGASTTPGYYLLPEILGSFHARHPDVELACDVENSSSISRRLLRNELDLGFVGGEIHDEYLKTEPVGSDEIVCYVGRSHPLARARRVTPAKLVAETCVTREEGSATRRMFESWLIGTGCRLERKLVVKCPEAAKAYVAAGIGFSFLSSLGLESDLRSKRFVTLPVAGLRLRRPITVAWHRNKRFTEPMARLLALVHDRELTASA